MTTQSGVGVELRASRREAIAWLGAVGAAGLTLLTVRRPAGQLWPHVFDLLHVLLSAAIAVVALRLWRRLRPRRAADGWTDLGAAWGIVVCLGGGLEVAQLFGAGSPSLRDFTLDAAGGAAALGVVVAKEQFGARPKARALLMAASLTALVVALLPSSAKVWGVARRAYAFPVLSAFSPSERAFLLLNEGATMTPLADDGAPKGDWRVSVQLPAGGYSGVELTPPLGDWSLYKELVIPVFSHDTRAFPLAVRVSDWKHTKDFEDRFDQAVMVQPGPNEFRFALSTVAVTPGGRRLQLNQTASIILYAPRLPESHTVLLGPWRLENRIEL